MKIRDLTDEAKKLFDLTTDYIVEKTAPAYAEIKKKVADRKVPWMITAKANLGTNEYAGYRNNPTIIRWAKNIGGFVRRNYTEDSTPWCGLFVAHCLHVNQIPITIRNPLGARQWLKFGNEIEPCFGAIMVFWRGSISGWRGHVAFYVSEDDNYYHVVGGNQGNSVTVQKYPKSNFLGARWPKGYNTLYKQNKGRRFKKFDGRIAPDYE